MTSSSSSASSSTENVTSPTNTTDNNNEASVGAEEEEVGTRGQASRDMSSMYSEAASLMAAASSQTLDQDKLTKVSEREREEGVKAWEGKVAWTYLNFLECMHSSVHQSIHPSIHQSINPLVFESRG